MRFFVNVAVNVAVNVVVNVAVNVAVNERRLTDVVCPGQCSRRARAVRVSTRAAVRPTTPATRASVPRATRDESVNVSQTYFKIEIELKFISTTTVTTTTLYILCIQYTFF